MESGKCSTIPSRKYSYSASAQRLSTHLIEEEEEKEKIIH